MVGIFKDDSNSDSYTQGLIVIVIGLFKDGSNIVWYIQKGVVALRFLVFLVRFVWGVFVCACACVSVCGCEWASE